MLWYRDVYRRSTIVLVVLRTPTDKAYRYTPEGKSEALKFT
jgi:hypothetical protein